MLEAAIKYLVKYGAAPKKMLKKMNPEVVIKMAVERGFKYKTL